MFDATDDDLALFSEMQMLAEANAVDNSVAKTRARMNEMVAWFKSLSYYEDQLDQAAYVRGLSMDVLKKLDGFMVVEELTPQMMPEEFRDSFYGMVNVNQTGRQYITFSGRFVYPIKDVHGDVMGFTGWDKFEIPKYMDSKNFGYKAKETTFYGMENLPAFYEQGYIIFSEGPGDRARWEDNGILAGSFLGSYINPYVAQILNRFGSKAIIVHDADEAGLKLAKQAHRVAPKAITMCCTYANDPDDAMKDQERRDGFIEEVLKTVKRPVFRRFHTQLTL